MWKSVIVVVTSILIAGISHISAMAQAPVQENAVMMLIWVDHETVHQKLYELCLKEYPETSSSFKEGVSRWGEKNYPALKKLRLLYRDTFLAGGMTADKADAVMSKNVEFMTKGYLKSYMDLPASDMHEVCRGQFVDKILPQLDFGGILDSYDAKVKLKQ